MRRSLKSRPRRWSTGLSAGHLRDRGHYRPASALCPASRIGSRGVAAEAAGVRLAPVRRVQGRAARRQDVRLRRRSSAQPDQQSTLTRNDTGQRWQRAQSASQTGGPPDAAPRAGCHQRQRHRAGGPGCRCRGGQRRDRRRDRSRHRVTPGRGARPGRVAPGSAGAPARLGRCDIRCPRPAESAMAQSVAVEPADAAFRAPRRAPAQRHRGELGP